MTAAAAVVVRDLHKRYGQTHAVRGVSFEVAPGEIFGLLGPNGAGKTTTLECMIGLRLPDSGGASIAGFDAAASPREVKQRIGVQLQSTALPDRITVRESLDLFASFYRDRESPDELLQRFSLADKAKSRFENLSIGQRQRLAVAIALVNRPAVLFLDEPTAALDPQSRRELHAVLRRLRDEGRTIVLTTHYIEEAEQLCDRIAIIDNGRIIASGTPAELTRSANQSIRVAFTAAREVELMSLRALPAVQHVENRSTGYVLSTTQLTQTVLGLTQLLQTQGNDLLDLNVHRPTLEDVFIEMTGRKIRD
jgi:ABC-2 type transport system ATP-binding protein